MDKGKAPRERNSRQKSVSRRASTASLLGKNDMCQPKAIQVERSPSVQNTVQGQAHQEAMKVALINKAVETCIPKTRFKSQDSKELRSISSPRIKSFPAEKVRRIDNLSQSPRYPASAMTPGNNPNNPGNLYVPSASAIVPVHGQRDTTQMQCQQNINSPIQNQAYPQQVNYQLPQLRPMSDGMLAQTNVSQNYQVHRPFVPTNNHTTVHKNVSHGDQQPRDNQDSNYDPDTQPVGGRNAAMYRQTVTNNLQGQYQSSMSADQLGLRQTSNHHDQSNFHHRTDTRSFHSQAQLPCTQRSNLQQVYQQSPRNLVPLKEGQQQPASQQAATPQTQQQLQPYVQPDQQAYFNYYNQQQIAAKNYGHAGMTSPQDVIINQIKNSRNLMYSNHQLAGNDRSIPGYIIPPQKGGADPNQMRQNYSGSQNQQGTQPVGIDSSKVVDEHMKLYQQYKEPVEGVQHPTIRSKDGEMMAQRSSAAAPEGQNKENYNRNMLKFTNDMIRDQEMLVSTMRQQGVPDEIMRRQFDILLREQRKQLMYMVQMKEDKDSSEVKTAAVLPRRRRQTDEKPEWMAHITPPRRSYFEKERPRHGGEGRENAAQNSKKDEVYEQKQVQQRMDQGNPGQKENQMVQYQQIHAQNQGNPYAYWQQYPVGYQQQPVAYPTNANLHPQTLQSSHQSSVAQESNNSQPQNLHNETHLRNYQLAEGNLYWPQHQVPQQPYNNTQSVIQNQQACQLVEQKSRSNSDGRERLPNGPYSLLKMKVYKEVVRPRKRNNGLQDLEAVQQMAENLKTPEGMKGLEYLANMDKKLGQAKLNGVQDSSVAHADLIEGPPMETAFQRQKRVSANGLENTRNPNNPPGQQRLAALRASQSETLREFPMQKQYNPRERYTMQAERDTGIKPSDQHPHNYQQPMHSQQQVQGYASWTDNQPNATSVSCNNMHQFRFNSCAQQQQQQQQLQPYNVSRTYQPIQGEGDRLQLDRSKGLHNVNFNRAAGDAGRNEFGQDGEPTISQNKIAVHQFANPSYQMNHHYYPREIHEPKTIGGIKYLARKPMFIPTQRMSMPESSIPNMPMQVLTNA